MRHPAVREAATFGVAHPSLGEDVVTAIILREPGSANARQLRDYALKHLARIQGAEFGCARGAPRATLGQSSTPRLGRIACRNAASGFCRAAQRRREAHCGDVCISSRSLRRRRPRPLLPPRRRLAAGNAGVVARCRAESASIWSRRQCSRRPRSRSLHNGWRRPGRCRARGNRREAPLRRRPRSTLAPTGPMAVNRAAEDEA